MQAGYLPGADRALARAIRGRRADIVRSLLEGAIRRQEVTVGCELLALSFVDRFADAMETRSWPAFFVWIERTCDKYNGAASTSRLLNLGIATIGASVQNTTSDDAASRTGLAAIAEQVLRIVSRPRHSPSVPANQSLDEVDVALDQLMSRLTKFDAATADHSRAVSMWCARIGKKMSLSTSETAFVMRAGLIHDIGKVTTPPHILNAPHRLSDSDMAIMREHAAAGAAIVSEISLLAHLTPAVRGHHERVDGRGYPNALEGSEIPVAVRIVSVADSFNAMIGNRPYRSPMAPTAALEQLRIHSGSQFDPNVVSAMIEVVHPQR